MYAAFWSSDWLFAPSAAPAPFGGLLGAKGMVLAYSALVQRRAIYVCGRFMFGASFAFGWRWFPFPCLSVPVTAPHRSHAHTQLCALRVTETTRVASSTSWRILSSTAMFELGTIAIARLEARPTVIARLEARAMTEGRQPTHHPPAILGAACGSPFLRLQALDPYRLVYITSQAMCVIESRSMAASGGCFRGPRPCGFQTARPTALSGRSTTVKHTCTVDMLALTSFPLSLPPFATPTPRL